MRFVRKNIKWIMFVSGIGTLTMMATAIAPQLALPVLFGSTLEGPLAELVVRNWGVLVSLIGGMLIYGAYQKEVRIMVLSVAAMSKILFISLVISYGFGSRMFSTLFFDAFFVLLFIIYIASCRNEHHS